MPIDMKKIITSLLGLLLGVTIPATAQFRTITGDVVDQNNKPVAGAKVKVPFSKKSAQTDENGQFSIPIMKMPRKIRVTSPGKSVALLSPQENMHIKLTEKAVGTWQAEAWHPFVGLDFNFVFSGSGKQGAYFNQRNGVTTRTLGLVGGITDSRMGAYAKLHFLPLNDGDDQYEIASKRDVFDFAVGGIVHVWQPLYFNLGIGGLFYTERTHHFSDFNISSGYTDEKKKRAIADLGLSGRYTHYQLHAGVLTSFQRRQWHPYVGASYIF